MKYNFIKSPLKNKKYRVIFKHQGKEVKVDFGDKRYQQFKDRTPLKLYSHLDHGDTKRRKNYLARAKGIKNKKGELTKDDKTSPNYWSIRYLW